MWNQLSANRITFEREKIKVRFWAKITFIFRTTWSTSTDCASQSQPSRFKRRKNHFIWRTTWRRNYRT